MLDVIVTQRKQKARFQKKEEKINKRSSCARMNKKVLGREPCSVVERGSSDSVIYTM